jgi:hypothetical protein
MADDILIAMIIAGFGLSGAYFRAVFVSWRRYQAAEQEREISLRELDGHRLCRDKNDATGSSIVRVERSVDGNAATLAATTDAESGSLSIRNKAQRMAKQSKGIV